MHNVSYTWLDTMKCFAKTACGVAAFDAIHAEGLDCASDVKCHRHPQKKLKSMVWSTITVIR